MKLQLFKIKEGKKPQWVNWCNYLDENSDKVKLTLKQENCTRESFYMFGDYVVGYAEFNDLPISADMSNPLNAEHRKNFLECLEKVEGVTLYDISV